jgi:hypothetical protein
MVSLIHSNVTRRPPQKSQKSCGSKVYRAVRPRGQAKWRHRTTVSVPAPQASPELPARVSVIEFRGLDTPTVGMTMLSLKVLENRFQLWISLGSLSAVLKSTVIEQPGVANFPTLMMRASQPNSYP